jgi:hypothetical protein
MCCSYATVSEFYPMTRQCLLNFREYFTNETSSDECATCRIGVCTCMTCKISSFPFASGYTTVRNEVVQVGVDGRVAQFLLPMAIMHQEKQPATFLREETRTSSKSRSRISTVADYALTWNMATWLFS